MESSRFFEQLNRFWQKVPQQKLSILVTIMLLLYCANMVANMVWQLVPVSPSKGQFVTVSGIKSNATTQQASQLDMSALLKLNLFGDESKVPEVVKPVVTNTDAPKTRLNVTLTGLVADNSSSTSQTSVAIIESAGNQSTYGIGETIDKTQAKVDQILLDRVILSVSGRYETLMLEGIEYSTTIPGSADEMVDETSKLADSQIIKGTARPTVKRPKVKATPKKMDKRADVELSKSLREQREQLFSDPKKLMDYIRIRPDRKGGELRGYRLTPGKDPSLFKQVGLKHNDLAVNINGFDLTDMKQALSVMRELRSMTEASITVLREDTTVEIILAL
ncbi:type II secretion system protein GspC [Psychrosphaera sp. 1_MG-2023]|uniref:type II secretion system protein GspC n=1 Tax=Psychrosphaera sp. 1_MG-2023 TaxID=3062643 RepID=UPI0026E14258|nr:type II secretion system protein GspC [Psychrosphaera sp. 1_MG-2023]MDO6720457.1 type II secretion system protein GspC [Psychrosphaera sp. 1_MG-2023]